MVSLSPNLGWRDEPLGERLAARPVDRRPDLARQRIRPGRPRRAPAGRGPGPDRRRPRLGLGRRRRRPDRRRGAAHRRRGLWRRGRAHPGQPRRRALSLRLDRLLGDRGRRAARCCAGPATHRKAALTSVAAVLREAEAGSPTALAALAETGAWLGLRAGRHHQHPEPAARPARRRLRPDLSVRADHAGGRARPARPPGHRRGLVRVLPTRLGVDAPLLGAAELAFEPLLTTRGLVASEDTPDRAGIRLEPGRTKGGDPTIPTTGLVAEAGGSKDPSHDNPGAGTTLEGSMRNTEETKRCPFAERRRSCQSPHS